VESVIILLVLLVVLGAWQARIHAASVAAAYRHAARRVSEYSQSR
jgi:Sec-independent protein translocase protein TatA